MRGVDMMVGHVMGMLLFFGIFIAILDIHDRRRYKAMCIKSEGLAGFEILGAIIPYGNSWGVVTAQVSHHELDCICVQYTTHAEVLPLGYVLGRAYALRAWPTISLTDDDKLMIHEIIHAAPDMPKYIKDIADQMRGRR